MNPFHQKRRWKSLALLCYILTTTCVNGDMISLQEKENRHQYHFSSRNLQSGIPYRVELFLALDYLNDTIAIQFESLKSILPSSAVAHFCSAVNTQVRLIAASRREISRFTRVLLTLHVRI
jgi:hypothetical protein